jgi:two-component system, NarL family, nitrate/nitrite response regulator NarL
VVATRVAIVEQHVLLAESLSLALAEHGFATTTVHIPADAAGADVLLEPTLALHPKVVVLNPDLGGTRDAMALVQLLHAAGCAVVVVTATRDDERWGQALALGAHAVLSESEGLDKVTETLRLAGAGEAAMDEPERVELVRQWRRQQLRREGHRARLALLTPRECEVLGQLVEGERVGDIARHFHVSEATVRTQVQSVLSKLSVNSQIAAVAITHDVRWPLSG